MCQSTKSLRDSGAVRLGLSISVTTHLPDIDEPVPPRPTPSKQIAHPVSDLEPLIAARVRSGLETAADVLGEETGALLNELQTKLRSEFSEQIGQLRAELATLRGYMQASNEISELKRQIEILRDDRVLDLTAMRKVG